MAKPKVARNQAVIGLYEAGLSTKEIAERIRITEGGVKGLLSRLAEKGLIKRDRRKIAKAPEKEKVRKEEIKITGKEEIKKVRKEEKQKVGYILPVETIKILDLYRADHRDRSLSEIVNSSILEFLKRRNKSKERI